MSSVFFFENLDTILEAYSYSYPEFNYTNVSFKKLENLFNTDPNNYIIQLWKQLIIDNWHYEQTSTFVRPRWNSEQSILYDVNILLKASYKYI
jgi:hypothetical protein